MRSDAPRILRPPPPRCAVGKEWRRLLGDAPRRWSIGFAVRAEGPGRFARGRASWAAPALESATAGRGRRGSSPDAAGGRAERQSVGWQNAGGLDRTTIRHHVNERLFRQLGFRLRQPQIALAAERQKSPGADGRTVDLWACFQQHGSMPDVGASGDEGPHPAASSDPAKNFGAVRYATRFWSRETGKCRDVLGATAAA